MPNETQSRTEQRAREIWEREGRPDGRSDEHWRLALEELAQEDAEEAAKKAAEEAAAKKAAEAAAAKKAAEEAAAKKAAAKPAPAPLVAEKKPVAKGKAPPKKK